VIVLLMLMALSCSKREAAIDSHSRNVEALEREDSDVVMSSFKRASEALETEDYDVAITYFSEVIRLKPAYATAHGGRGVAYASKGDYDQALADFTEAIRLAPAVAALYNNRGAVHASRGDYDKAIADYEKAISIDPKYVSAYRDLAWLQATCPDARYRNGKQAVENARKACDLSDWRDWSDLAILAAAYAESGNFDEAIKWQNEAIELAPQSKRAACRSRLELYKSGKPYRKKPTG
jgi:tetratricopeptide (TPR) repeat protein